MEEPTRTSGRFDGDGGTECKPALTVAALTVAALTVVGRDCTFVLIGNTEKMKILAMMTLFDGLGGRGESLVLARKVAKYKKS